MNVLYGAAVHAAAAIHTAIPSLRTYEAYRGAVTADEILRISKSTPAVLVSAVGVDGVELVGDGTDDIGARFAAFVVHTAAREEPAAEVVVAIVRRLARWRVPDAISGHAERIQAHLLSGDKMTARALTLWAITWRQQVRAAAAATEDGVVPSSLYLEDELLHPDELPGVRT